MASAHEDIADNATTETLVQDVKTYSDEEDSGTPVPSDDDDEETTAKPDPVRQDNVSELFEAAGAVVDIPLTAPAGAAVSVETREIDILGGDPTKALDKVLDGFLSGALTSRQVADLALNVVSHWVD